MDAIKATYGYAIASYMRWQDDDPGAKEFEDRNRLTFLRAHWALNPKEVRQQGLGSGIGMTCQGQKKGVY